MQQESNYKMNPGVREFSATVTNNKTISEKYSQLQPCGLYYTSQKPILSTVVAKTKIY